MRRVPVSSLWFSGRRACVFSQRHQQPRFDSLHAAAHGGPPVQSCRVDIHGVLLRGKAQRDGARHQARQRGEQGQRAFPAQPQRNGDDHLVERRMGTQRQPRHLHVGPHQFDHEVRRQP